MTEEEIEKAAKKWLEGEGWTLIVRPQGLSQEEIFIAGFRACEERVRPRKIDPNDESTWPKDDQDCLILWYSESVSGKRFLTSDTARFRRKTKDFRGWREYKEVTHWCPLPLRLETENSDSQEEGKDI